MERRHGNEGDEGKWDYIQERQRSGCGTGLDPLQSFGEYPCTVCHTGVYIGNYVSEAQVRPDKMEVLATFCYLGDMLSTGGGCELAVTTCVIGQEEI